MKVFDAAAPNELLTNFLCTERKEVGQFLLIRESNDDP